MKTEIIKVNEFGNEVAIELIHNGVTYTGCLTEKSADITEEERVLNYCKHSFIDKNNDNKSVCRFCGDGE